ncbi:MAG: sugar kinase [Candidatus Aenigmatarchaeota archaeon]|nr:MAG: sugar kinase [Candidatus Aenigmarchaeota archaeon]
MVNLIALGTIALDTVKTPFGEVKDAIGGTATYFSLGASLFSPVGIISAIGRDFPENGLEILRSKGVCTKGVQKLDKRTFRWNAYYEYDMNEAHTIDTNTEILENFIPKIPDEYKDAEFLFLGNTDPEIQIYVMEQMKGVRFSVLDTMDYWIKSKKEKLLEAASKVNLFLMNEWEARMLFDTSNLVVAGKKAVRLGPEYVIIKKGEHGSLLFSNDSCFSIPGYPLENVKDPTGAGDSFAGGLMGWLSRTGDTCELSVRKAMVYGSVIASYNAEGFSIEKLKILTLDDVGRRYEEFKKLVRF